MQGLNSSGLKQISSFKSEKSFLQEVQSINEVEQNVFKGLKKSASRTFSVNIQPSDQFGEYLRGKTSKNDAEFLVKINSLHENKPLAICKKNQRVSIIDDNMEQLLNAGDKIAYESASQLLQLASLFNSGDKVIVNGSHVEKIFNLSHEVQKKPLAKSIVIENEKSDKNQTVITIKPVVDNKNNKTVNNETLLSQLGNNLPVQRERVEISDSDLRLLFLLANQITSDKNGSIQLSKLAETVCLSDSQNNESKLFSESKLVDSLITKVGDVFKGKSDSKELGVMIKTMVGIVNRIYDLQSQPKLAGLSLTYKEDDILIARKIVSSNPVSLVEQSRKGVESGESLSAAFRKTSDSKSTQNQDVESIIEKIYQDVNSPLENLFLSQKKAQSNVSKDKNIILQPGIAENIMRNGKEFYYFPKNLKDLSAKRNEITGLNTGNNDLLPESKSNNVSHLIRDEAEFRRISKKTISQLLKMNKNRAGADDDCDAEGEIIENLSNSHNFSDKQKPYLSVKLDSTLVNVYNNQPVIDALKQGIEQSAAKKKSSDREKMVKAPHKTDDNTGVDLTLDLNLDSAEPAKQKYLPSNGNESVSKKKNPENLTQTPPLDKWKNRPAESFSEFETDLLPAKKISNSASSLQNPVNKSKEGLYEKISLAESDNSICVVGIEDSLEKKVISDNFLKNKNNHSIAEQIDEYINLKKMNYGNKLSMEKKSDFFNVQNAFTVIEVNDNTLDSKPSSNPALMFEQKSSGTDDLSILQKKLTYALTRSIMDIVDNKEERNRIVMQIKPDSMGNIRIDVVNKDKVLEIRFDCSDPLTQKMVESEKDKLKEVIHDKGFQISSLFISDNHDSKENTASENSHDDSRQHQNESSEDHEPPKDPNKEKQEKGGSRDNTFQFSVSFVNLLEDSNYLSKDLIGTL